MDVEGGSKDGESLITGMKLLGWQEIGSKEKIYFERRYEEEDERRVVESSNTVGGVKVAVGRSERGRYRGLRNFHDCGPNGNVRGVPKMDIETPSDLDRHSVNLALAPIDSRKRADGDRRARSAQMSE